MQDTEKLDKSKRTHIIIRTVLYGRPTLKEAAEDLGLSVRTIQRIFSEYGLPLPSARLSREHVAIIYEAGLRGLNTGEQFISYTQQKEQLVRQLKEKDVALMENLVALSDKEFTEFLTRLFGSRTKRQVLNALSNLNQSE